MSLQAGADRVAQAIRASAPGSRWFIDCDTDADGVCGAAVLAHALRGIGHRFQVRASRDKTDEAYRALAEEACDGYILIDKGTSHQDTLSRIGKTTGRPVVIIDHHNVPGDVPENVATLNPRLEGMDGSRDASAATTAMAVALALDDANLPMGAAALAGAIGDWQHDGGWQGWNQDLLARLEEAGHVTRRHVPAFIGIDLQEAVGRRLGLDDAKGWLESLDLDAAAEAEDLEPEAAARLVSAATLHMLSQGRNETMSHEVLWDARLGGVRHAFRVVDACGRSGQASTGLAFLWGSSTARAEAESIFRDYKQRLATALQAVRTPTELGALRWVRIDDASLTGMTAGLGVVHFAPDARRPLVVVADRDDGMLQISSRGTHDQVAAGMDLGLAIGQAAGAVGAEGGGHPIASGAVIRAAGLDAFLAALDEALQAQGVQA